MALNMKSLNIALLNPDEVIRQRQLEEVTSPFIHVSSTNEPDPDGIFSERIFGQLASDARMVTHGYIRLNCQVFHPVIFENLRILKRFYIDVMAGKAMAKWDNELKDIVRAAPDEPDANTGFAFFLSYFPRIVFRKNNSLKRNDKIDNINKYRNSLLIDKMLVMPAGIRDLNDEDGRIEKDSINSLYTALLRAAQAMPKDGNLDPIYDTIHYTVQRRVIEIYNYIENMVEGKRGFLQGKLGHRSIAHSCRNVITATSLEAESPESPQYHRCDETKVPLFMTAKGFIPLVVYQIRSLFYNTIINQSSENVALINTNTLNLEYVQIDDQDKDFLLTDEGIEKMVDRFRDPGFRFKPVAVRSEGVRYYLYLVYDDEDKIYIFRNLHEFKADYTGTFDMKKLRALTYAEMLYIATYLASKDKNGLCVRYPVTDEQSIYPAKTHVVTTDPARIVTLVSDPSTSDGIMLPEYPIVGRGWIDAVLLHPTKLKGLGADLT